MKNTVLPKIAAAAAIVIAASLSGCGSIYANYRETENLQVVQTLGLDSMGAGVTVTASTGQGLGGEEGVIISRPATSIISGIEAIHHYSSKEALYLDHTRFVLLGEEAARGGFAEFSDYLLRSSRLRMDMTLFALTNGAAKDLITGGGTGDYNITNTLASIETDAKNLGVGYDTACREVLRSINEYGAALVCAVDSAESEDAVFSESGDCVPIPAGYVIMKGEQRRGELDKTEAWAANLLLNRSGFGSVTLPMNAGGSAVLVLDSAETEFTAVWAEDGSLERLEAKLSLEANLGELTGGIEVRSESAQELSDKLKNYTERFCLQVLEKSRELSADFLGLYGVLRCSYPAEARPYKGLFEELISEAEITVTADCTVSVGYHSEES